MDSDKSLQVDLMLHPAEDASIEGWLSMGIVLKSNMNLSMEEIQHLLIGKGFLVEFISRISDGSFLASPESESEAARLLQTPLNPVGIRILGRWDQQSVRCTRLAWVRCFGYPLEG